VDVLLVAVLAVLVGVIAVLVARGQWAAGPGDDLEADNWVRSLGHWFRGTPGKRDQS